MKSIGYTVSFQEVPDEVSLVFLISQCGYHCKGCHSPELQTNIGNELTFDYVKEIMLQYKDAISCVCFMGEGKRSNFTDVADIANKIRLAYPNIKTCLYTGAEFRKLRDSDIYLLINSFNYIKTGQYKEELGALDDSRTNQRFYKVIEAPEPFDFRYEDMHKYISDITYRFTK